MEQFSMTTGQKDLDIFDKTGLIDADFIKYIATYRYKQMLDRFEVKGNDIEALEYTIEDIIGSIVPYAEIKGMIFCFSGSKSNSYREVIAQEKEYKGGSRKNREPMYDLMSEHMWYVQTYMKKKYDILYYPDLEADDILSMLQNQNTFIYSKDKDMLQIPGWHYNIKTDEFYAISEEEAWKFLIKQSVIGDSTDNIPGYFRLGEKKVGAIFDDLPVERYLMTAIQLFIDKKGTPHGFDEFVENYMLVRLMRDRGKYIKEKYNELFILKDKLINLN